MYEYWKEKVKDFPQFPGVYIYKDAEGDVIYVGKAKNLRHRVGSYFQTNLDPNTKTYALVHRINDVGYILVDNEFDALILEAELVKRYNPKYNIVLKDDRSFLYIVIRNEKVLICGKSSTIPKVLAQRKTELHPRDIKFGPYTSSGSTKHIVKVLRKVFKYRDCSSAKFTKYHKIGDPCLFGHINQCLAPCAHFHEVSLRQYKDNIQKIKKVLKGGSSALVNDLHRKMKILAKKQDFEEAAKYRDLLDKFNYVRQNYREASVYIDNPYLMSDLSKKALDDLSFELPMLTESPKRIECYDISNISGKHSVGSMVVASDGRIDKDEYRHFKIKLKDTPDDFDMIFEVLHRRFQTDWEFPNLVVVDGGKGQVSAAEEALKDLNINIPVIGLAKKYETVVYRKGTEFIEKNLDKNQSALKLLIQLRDEAHRFAQSYHHKLRLKSLGV